MKIFKLIIIILSVAASLNAQSVDIEYVSSILWSNVKDVVLDSNYAYCAFSDGLVVLDISDLTSPSFVAQLFLENGAENLDISGNHVFVVNGSPQMNIIDVSNPLSPLIANGYVASQIVDVDIDGNYAYLAQKNEGIQILDISDPENPIFMGSCSTSVYASRLMVQGDYAYAAAEFSPDPGLQIIDVSDPSAPFFLGNLPIEGNPHDLYITGGYAYFATSGPGQLHVIDISNPALPTQAGLFTIPTQQAVSSVFTSGDYSYLGVGSLGLNIVNVSDPSNPFFTGSLNISDTPNNNILVRGSFVYLPGVDGLHIIDVLDPYNPGLAGRYDAPQGLTYDVCVSGNYAYVANGRSGLQIVDVTDPNLPVIAGSHDTNTGQAYSVAVSDDYAYVAFGRAGLVIYDISISSNPLPIGSWISDVNYSEAREIIIKNHYAFIAYGSQGLQIVDVFDPTQPLFVGSYVTQGETYGIALFDEYAFLADWTSSHLVDISDPTDPLSVWSGSWARDVEVVGNYAFVLGYMGYSNVRIFNISDPYNPVAISGFDGYDSYGIHFSVSGRYAFLGEDFNMVDLCDLYSPVHVGQFAIPGNLWGVFYSAGYAYLASGNSLVILSVSQQGGCEYINGDINNDGIYNGLDIVYGVGFLKGEFPSFCYCECPPYGNWIVVGDVNGSCSYNGLDITYGVAFLKGGDPPHPCPDCPPAEP